MEQFNTLQSASESYIHKRNGEKIRRAMTTKRMEELRQLVQEGKHLTAEGILKKALQISSDLLKTSNFSVQGVSSGFRRIESLTSSFVSSLGFPQNVTEELAQRLHQFFKTRFDSRYKSSHLPVEDHPDFRGQSRKCSSSTESTSGFPTDNKKRKAGNEQLRRNGLLKANNDLMKFIFDNDLAPRSYNMEKLKILEIIIDFIKEKRNNRNQPKSVEDMALYTKGILEGQSFGKALATMFFKTDQHLIHQCTALEMYLDLHLNPQPLLGYPQLSQFPPVPSMPVLLRIPNIEMPYPTPPLSASGSPPCLSPPTSSSSCFIPAIKETKSSIKIEEKKFFRPWE